ncbi:MAG: hypothetical protein ACI8QZ_003340 [Chlamydiales bacterium]|jgi:hypothetical protein
MASSHPGTPPSPALLQSPKQRERYPLPRNPPPRSYPRSETHARILSLQLHFFRLPVFRQNLKYVDLFTRTRDAQ